MRKFIVFEDGTERELSPLGYQEFVKLGLWRDSSDMDFEQWKRHNNLRELEDFNIETRLSSVIVLRGGHKQLEFCISHDHEFEPVWQPYDPVTAITEQHNAIGSKCRPIAAKFLAIWRRGGLKGLIGHG